MKNYKKTKIACYLGFITQAIAANFAPLLFLKFHTDYNISLGNIALISTCFFFTQLVVDLFCAKFVDRIGYRTCIVASEVCSALGLVGLAFLPDLLLNPYTGIIISVIIYAIGSGLIEVLCSPIVEACPFENKEATMSLLHSFYCWGAVGTILVSTAFFAIFGIDSWKWLAVLLAMVPAINIYNFATCPIEYLVEDGEGMSIPSLFKTPLFWVAIILMVCSGASELSMAQWASAYAEAALGLSKTMGDLMGPCLFAVAMGISRMLYGKYGEKVNLSKFMLGSGVLCVLCYVLASLFSNPIVGLIGCILCGFSVGIMWPGTLSISSKKFPTGGTAMFALLAMAGDLGGSIGPGIVGRVTQMAGDNIRTGMTVGLIFPVVLVVGLLFFDKMKSR
ncbi:MFS transporter [Cellulosilyticum sp. WCF-2]|uniref:MFS transporter n=1 Tax=Cellulosilyticum sp. WCF-2 TaxID=2497860 RepID=UPI000F8DFC05|nr:MFS transporter [Cellulosilyticum sp. WCF-2]QEH70599.1 MFS transporter [Cellulosilyticum sp. WCF-2]